MKHDLIEIGDRIVESEGCKQKSQIQIENLSRAITLFFVTIF